MRDNYIKTDYKTTKARQLVLSRELWNAFRLPNADKDRPIHLFALFSVQTELELIIA